MIVINFNKLFNQSENSHNNVYWVFMNASSQYSWGIVVRHKHSLIVYVQGIALDACITVT